jgi:hypothetical protein
MINNNLINMQGLILSDLELSVRTKLSDSGCAIKLQPCDFSKLNKFSENIAKWQKK